MGIREKSRFMAVQYFTVEEANRTLPLVKRIVADILNDYDVWRDRMRRYELLSAGAATEDGESDDQIRLREEVDEVARRISGYMEELEQVGCLFKGFEQGLVDFYHKRDGRDVLLCWRYGEPEVGHWHEVDGGFAGRQRLQPDRVLGDV